MQHSTNPTIDFLSELNPEPFLLFDSVVRGFCDGIEVVVKKIPRQTPSTDDDVTKLLTQLDHENVLKILAVDDGGTWISSSDSASSNFVVSGAYRYVMMPLCEATLEDFCGGKYDGPMPPDMTVLNQIANGVKYIHSKGLVHGNIKPTNILISTERPIQLKLSDFGLTECLTKKGILGFPDDKKCENPFNRSRYWIAFELLEHFVNEESTSPIQATLSSDIFSTGCLFFYFLTRGIHLYGPPNFIVRNILEGNLINRSQLPKDHYATPIIIQMVAKQSENRINIKQVVAKIGKETSKGNRNVPLMEKDNLENVFKNEIQPITQSIFSMKWSEKKKIFRGSFSVVFEAFYAGGKVAVKEIQRANLNPNFNNDEVENMIKLLDHPNILKLYSVIHKPHHKYFAIELCSATLKQYGTGEYKGPMPDLGQGLYQMTCGLQYIHSQRLIHRDIKPSNVLISGTNPVQLKWSDFGLSKAMDEPGTYTPNAPKGTYDWMAPEIICNVTGKSGGSNSATTFSDIFSAGCVFFFFLEPPLHPFGHEAQIRLNILEGNPLNLLEITEVEEVSVPYYDLIFGMINLKPQERIPLGNVIDVIKSFSITYDDSSYKQSKIMTPQLPIQTNKFAYREEDVIGQGSFGPFFIDRIQDTSVAVIGVDRSQITEICKQEEFNWNSIDHENVAKFVANENDPRFRFYATELHVMSLDELYSDDRPNFERKSFLKIPSDHSILIQLTSGLDFIHAEGLIFCNINPENVLLFSLSRIKWANQLGLKMKVTPKILEWMAPEILARDDNNLYYKYCDTFSDVFSAGCVFFFFLTRGIHLFSGGTGTNVTLTNILQCQKKNLKELLKESWIIELVDDLTNHDPKLRPCAADVIRTLTSSKPKLSRLDKIRLSIRYFSDIRSNSLHTDAISTWNIQFSAHGQSDLSDSILKQLHHPNIITTNGYCHDQNIFHQNDKWFTVIPHCVANLGQLFLADDSMKYNGPMPTDEQVLFQLASGLDYIHSKDIIHRNIRPENILIVTSTNSVQIKISNFTFSVRYQDLMKSPRQLSNNTSQESINWVSPEEKLLIEIMKKQSYENQNNVALKFRFVHCDTFSCGCVFLYFLLRGIHPFGSIPLVIPTNIATGNPVNLKELPENHFARSFVTQMIEINPEKTISLSQVTDYLKSLLPKDYFKTRNRLANFYHYGKFNLVHSGPLCSVHHVTQQDGTQMAVKIIPIDASALPLEFMSKLFDELKTLHHPNIVKMFEFDHDKLYRYYSLDYCKVSLDQWMETKGNYALLNDGQFFFQLTSGLRHIHEKDLVHGSIKPSNIFVVDCTLKLSSDFGITRENQLALLSSSPIWLAPELLQELMQHSPGQMTIVQCSRESDIFAAGNAFFYYWSRGQNLFSIDKNDTSATLKNILNGNQVNLFEFKLEQEESSMDKEKGVTRWMTQRDPKQRPSLQQIRELESFFNRFPPPADKLEKINTTEIDRTAKSTLKIEYSKDHVLGISVDGLSTVFLGLAIKTMNRRSPDWIGGKPVTVAVKRMPIVESVWQLEVRKNRAKILMGINHVNVVRLYSFANDSNFMVLALEKCQTSLHEYFRKPIFYHDFIKMPSDKDVLVQMTKGLDYIHSLNFIYRDIKPENVLISESNPVVMKWADFRVSRAMIPGTGRWLANEMIDTNNEANRLLNFALSLGSVECDTFALGCIFFFFLMSGIHPFGDDDNIIQENIKQDNPVHVDRLLPCAQFASTAIKRMIAKNISTRPKLSDVITCLEKEIPLE